MPWPLESGWVLALEECWVSALSKTGEGQDRAHVVVSSLPLILSSRIAKERGKRVGHDAQG